MTEKSRADRNRPDSSIEPSQQEDLTSSVVASSSALTERLKADGYEIDFDTGYWSSAGSYFAFRPSGSVPNKVKFIWAYELDPTLLRRPGNSKLDKAICDTIRGGDSGLRTLPRLYSHGTLALGISMKYSSIDQIFSTAETISHKIQAVLAKHFEKTVEAIPYVTDLDNACLMQIEYSRKQQKK